MRKDAWMTYNRNQNRRARRLGTALGSRKVNLGLTYDEGQCANQVVYCGACRGPVVNDEVGRRRHALKSAACKAEMEKGEK
jgi:hypothetical protein